MCVCVCVCVSGWGGGGISVLQSCKPYYLHSCFNRHVIVLCCVEYILLCRTHCAYFYFIFYFFLFFPCLHNNVYDVLYCVQGLTYYCSFSQQARNVFSLPPISSLKETAVPDAQCGFGNYRTLCRRSPRLGIWRKGEDTGLPTRGQRAGKLSPLARFRSVTAASYTSFSQSDIAMQSPLFAPFCFVCSEIHNVVLNAVTTLGKKAVSVYNYDCDTVQIGI